MLGVSLNRDAVARALDVGSATVEHWIAEGWLPTRRPMQADESIDLPQLLRFVRRHHLRLHHPDELGLSPEALAPCEPDEEVRRLLDALDSPAAGALGELLLGRYARIDDLPGYLDGPVNEALAQCRSQLTDTSSADDQGAQTLSCAALALWEAAQMLDADTPHHHRVMAACLDDDQDPTPAALAALILAERGRRLVGPGPTAGAPALARAADQHQPHAMILSVTHPSRPDAVTRDQLADLTHRLRGRGVRIIVLGPRGKLAPPGLPRARSMRELAELVG